MTLEPSDFPNGNGQNNHFDHDHNTILSSNGHGQMDKIYRYFNNKKSGIVEMVTIKFQLTILTTVILEFWDWSWSNLL
jgi:hypothetical protein